MTTSDMYFGFDFCFGPVFALSFCHWFVTLFALALGQFVCVYPVVSCTHFKVLSCVSPCCAFYFSFLFLYDLFAGFDLFMLIMFRGLYYHCQLFFCPDPSFDYDCQIQCLVCALFSMHVQGLFVSHVFFKKRSYRKDYGKHPVVYVRFRVQPGSRFFWQSRETSNTLDVARSSINGSFWLTKLTLGIHTLSFVPFLSFSFTHRQTHTNALQHPAEITYLCLTWFYMFFFSISFYV